MRYSTASLFELGPLAVTVHRLPLVGRQRELVFKENPGVSTLALHGVGAVHFRLLAVPVHGEFRLLHALHNLRRGFATRKSTPALGGSIIGGTNASAILFTSHSFEIKRRWNTSGMWRRGEAGGGVRGWGGVLLLAGSVEYAFCAFAVGE